MDSPPEHGRRWPHVKNSGLLLRQQPILQVFFMIDPYNKILAELQALGQGIVAIDGRCGSGKTNLGNFLKKNLSCNLVHMDDFYLPLPRREEHWREHPGKNMDFDRLIQQVLEPATKGEGIRYAPYDCGKKAYGCEIMLPPNNLTILEGSYSQFPPLRPYYTKMYFLTCAPEVQKQRLQSREGEKYPMFENLWIPLEEKYLALYPPAGNLVDTGTLF